MRRLSEGVSATLDAFSERILLLSSLWLAKEEQSASVALQSGGGDCGRGGVKDTAGSMAVPGVVSLDDVEDIVTAVAGRGWLAVTVITSSIISLFSCTFCTGSSTPGSNDVALFTAVLALGRDVAGLVAILLLWL